MAECHDRRTMERMREQFAHPNNELGTAQHVLDPGSAEGVEMDLIHAAVNASVALGDTLETVRLGLGKLIVGSLVVLDFTLGY
jgi:hypothetical protein